MLNYYREKAYGSKKPNVHILHFEFKSTPHPSLPRLWKYIKYITEDEWEEASKVKVGLMIIKYWWKQLFEEDVNCIAGYVMWSQRLALVLLTFNEAANLDRTLSNPDLAKDIVIVDTIMDELLHVK